MAESTVKVRINWSGGRERAGLEEGESGAGTIWLDSAAWFGWLEEGARQSFAYPIDGPGGGYIAGYMTVRKERRERGGEYWVAYRRVEGRLRKAYIGRSGEVTRERLGNIASKLQGKEVKKSEKTRD